MNWDDFRVLTSPKVKPGTIVMNPEDAAKMRSPTELVSSLARSKRVDGRRWKHLGNRSAADDDARREELRRQMEDLRRRNAD